MVKALITGCAGQSGSYLADFLIEKGYTVVGVVRRSSTTKSLWRIEHLLNNPKFILEEGDITDYGNIFSLFNRHKPDEVYNLGAQSHVMTSFSQPDYTWRSVYGGTLNCLEAIRQLGFPTRFYQASSSEQFGTSYSYYSSNYDIFGEHNHADLMRGDTHRSIDERSAFQYEGTPFNPQSPYAIAKVAAHQLTELYRKSYGIHASCGILNNHETLTYSTPLVCKIDGKINILPIGDIARFHTGLIFNMSGGYQEGEPIRNIEVWDKDGWTKVKYVSGYPHKYDKNPRIINARNSVYSATGSHVCIMDDDSEKTTSELSIGDRVKLTKYPSIHNEYDVSLEMAEFLGMLVGDGNLTKGNPRFTNKNENIRSRFIKLFMRICPNGTTKYRDTYSGFTGELVGQVATYGLEYDYDIYTDDMSVFGHKYKKVPQAILNSNRDVMEAFLVGYNICDGLKKGLGRQRFKNFKTNSPTLAAGLLYLVSKVTNQKYNITVEESFKHGKQQFYYSINLLSETSNIEKYTIAKTYLNAGYSQRRISRDTGISRTFIRKVYNGYEPHKTHSQELPKNEIKKIIEIPDYNGWFFDLETESGTFHAGIGQGVVHNSPRRGEKFVTQKIVEYIKMMQRTAGNCEKLRLGNLSPVRDWCHAKDMVRGMWMILQHDEPITIVLGSGIGTTVAEFVEKAFEKVGADWKDWVEIDRNLFRPSDVPYLRARPEKAKELLGWEPEYSLDDLITDMLATTQIQFTGTVGPSIMDSTNQYCIHDPIPELNNLPIPVAEDGLPGIRIKDRPANPNAVIKYEEEEDKEEEDDENKSKPRSGIIGIRTQYRGRE